MSSTGPKAFHRKVANDLAEASLSIDWLVGMAPPSESRIFFPIAWHVLISGPMKGQLESRGLQEPSLFL